MLYTGNKPESFRKDRLEVRVFPTLEEMGEAAARDAADAICGMLSVRREVNMIFAAAPSQEEFLGRLVADRRIDWSGVNAFHMDEYIGLDPGAPQSFGNFLRQRIFGKVPFRSVNYIDPQAGDPEEECLRYAALLRKYPVDIVCLGIGENGHIAFNDPGVADFNDPKDVKVVELDPICRQQQVNEKCFDTLQQVPARAITVTVPALLRAEKMFCIVPFANKAKAVRDAVEGPVSEKCPASVLRTRDNVTLYIDSDSASELSA